MEHVPDPQRMVGEIARVLRPGGAVILSVPFHEPLHEVPYDFYRFTPFSLRKLFEAHRLCVVEIHNRGGSIRASSYLLSSFLYRRFGATGYPGEMRTRPVVGPLMAAVCAAIQLLGAFFDGLARDDYDTIGFVVLAHKQADAVAREAAQA
jgi:SAM-dependent methyltransferase